jgi:hypothetical protein
MKSSRGVPSCSVRLLRPWAKYKKGDLVEQITRGLATRLIRSRFAVEVTEEAKPQRKVEFATAKPAPEAAVGKRGKRAVKASS